MVLYTLKIINMNKTIEEKIIKGLIAFWLVTVVAFTLSSCGSTYSTCPSYGNHNVNTTVNG